MLMLNAMRADILILTDKVAENISWKSVLNKDVFQLVLPILQAQ
jgi:hypothetical protein